MITDDNLSLATAGRDPTIECVFCMQLADARTMFHWACPECARMYDVQAPGWYEQPWFVDGILPLHRAWLRSEERHGQALDLDDAVNLTEEDKPETAPPYWQPSSEFHEAFSLVRDMHTLQGIKASDMRAYLRACDKQLKRNGHEGMRIPSERTVWYWVAAIKQDLSSDESLKSRKRQQLATADAS